jgi:hypothetical protein
VSSCARVTNTGPCDSPGCWWSAWRPICAQRCARDAAGVAPCAACAGNTVHFAWREVAIVG